MEPKIRWICHDFGWALVSGVYSAWKLQKSLAVPRGG
jgi:hypothetical protein